MRHPHQQKLESLAGWFEKNAAADRAKEFNLLAADVRLLATRIYADEDQMGIFADKINELDAKLTAAYAALKTNASNAALYVAAQAAGKIADDADIAAVDLPDPVDPTATPTSPTVPAGSGGDTLPPVTSTGGSTPPAPVALAVSPAGIVVDPIGKPVYTVPAPVDTTLWTVSTTIGTTTYYTYDADTSTSGPTGITVAGAATLTSVPTA